MTETEKPKGVVKNEWQLARTKTLEEQAEFLTLARDTLTYKGYDKLIIEMLLEAYIAAYMYPVG